MNSLPAIEYLDWDSRFFNQKIGKITQTQIKLRDAAHIIARKQKEEYSLVYISTKSITHEAHKLIEEHQGILVDHKVTYQKNLNVAEPKETDKNIQPYNGHLSDELLQLALLSGHSSRFKKDPRLNQKFDELYQNWIQKSIDRSLADITAVYKQNNEIQGFITIKKQNDYTQIGLIAVAPKAQGNNIGAKLIAFAEKWTQVNGYKQLKVVTQEDNLQACRFYSKTGFIPETTELIYHL